jgi:hypothetical protein
MSAADWMVIRTRDGYRSVPRRVGLGMISRGAGEAATTGAVQALPPEPPEPHDDEYEPVSTWSDDAPDPELEERRRVLGLKRDAEFVAVRGPIEYHLLEPVAGEPDADVPTVEAVELPDPPRGNAARQEWAAYASEYLGIEVTDAMNRNQIRDAAQEQLQSVARLPQPALPGGRLETPEDEPVTEGSVTDDEDPGTR